MRRRHRRLFDRQMPRIQGHQGSLEDGGKPAEGLYDVQLSVTDASQRTLAAPITLYGVKVSKGQFLTAVDFGVDLSAHGDLQLHAAVRQGSGATP